MDQDKMIGKADNKISQKEVDAYKRGKDDAQKNAKLSIENLRKNMSDKAILVIVQDYANGQHLEQISLRTGLKKSEITTILKALDIESGADARKFIDSQVNESLEDQNERKQKHAEAQLRLEEEKKRLAAKPEPIKRNVAHQNKLDKVREMLSTKLNKEAFKVQPSMELEFKSLVVYGLTAIRRKFGEYLTDKQIKSEIKRLLPGVNVDLVRP